MRGWTSLRRLGTTLRGPQLKSNISLTGTVGLISFSRNNGLDRLQPVLGQIYSFNYGGGYLLIQEQIGNNGHGYAIDVELDSLGSTTSISPSAALASIVIPFSSGPSAAYTLYYGDLAAGSYAIDSYLAVGNVADPNYQINFTVPEPTAMAVLSVGLIGLGYVSQRRRGASAAAAA